jgi:hypothetical protein
MNKIIIIAVIVLLVLLITWIAASWYSVRGIEEPNYTIVQKTDEYEIRTYDSYIVAETTVTSDSAREARNEGFRIIADYIFGNNVSQDKIAMTAPVLDSSDVSKKIAMTAPVLDESDGETHTIAFVMPSKYTLDTLPAPVSDKVNIRQVPSYQVAVRTYSWYPSESRDAKAWQSLTTALEEDDVQTTGNAQYAYYNPPLSFPLFLRNEVHIPVLVK